MDPFKSRRGRVELFGDVLEALDEDFRTHGNIRLTRVQGGINMAYDRFMILIETLAAQRLLSVEKNDGHFEVVLEERGSDFIRNYRRIKNLMDSLNH